MAATGSTEKIDVTKDLPKKKFVNTNLISLKFLLFVFFGGKCRCEFGIEETVPPDVWFFLLTAQLLLHRHRLPLPVSSFAYDEGGIEHREYPTRVDDLAGGGDNGSSDSRTDRRQTRYPPEQEWQILDRPLSPRDDRGRLYLLGALLLATVADTHVGSRPAGGRERPGPQIQLRSARSGGTRFFKYIGILRKTCRLKLMCVCVCTYRITPK